MRDTQLRIADGLYWLDTWWSRREKEILDDCCRFLEDKGFEYLQIPSTVSPEVYKRQGLEFDDGTELEGFSLAPGGYQLAGSAEQGILGRFADTEVESSLIYSRNQCFRQEAKYEGLLHTREFEKVEQYCFCYEEEVDDRFEFLLANSLKFLDMIHIGEKDRRVVDRTEDDRGYHLKKFDIEIRTKAYGWMETHSCSSFGQEQSKRFGITGANYTLSNTGIATPRILVPFIEAAGGEISSYEI